MISLIGARSVHATLIAVDLNSIRAYASFTAQPLADGTIMIKKIGLSFIYVAANCWIVRIVFSSESSNRSVFSLVELRVHCNVHLRMCSAVRPHCSRRAHCSRRCEYSQTSTMKGLTGLCQLCANLSFHIFNEARKRIRPMRRDEGGAAGELMIVGKTRPIHVNSCLSTASYCNGDAFEVEPRFSHCLDQLADEDTVT